MTPSVFWRGATSPATPLSSRRSRSTIGRDGEVSSRSSSGPTRHSSLTCSRSRAISAKGLSWRTLRPRRVLKALRTGCYVWRDQGAAPDPFPALLYPEASLLPDREGPPGHAFDHGQRRSFFLYLLEEAFQLLRRALRLDVDPLGVVAHQPGKPMPPRQSVDEGPKAHALHDAPHGDLPALLSRHSHGVSLCRFNRNSRSTSSTYSSSSC